MLSAADDRTGRYSPAPVNDPANLPSECWLCTCISEAAIWLLAQQLTRGLKALFHLWPVLVFRQPAARPSDEHLGVSQQRRAVLWSMYGPRNLGDRFQQTDGHGRAGTAILPDLVETIVSLPFFDFLFLQAFLSGFPESSSSATTGPIEGDPPFHAKF